MAKFLLKSLLLCGLILSQSSYVFAEKGDGIIDPGEDEAGELARAVQNPIASLISVPFQNNTSFNFGPQEKTQNVLNIQPVLPFSLNDDLNLITRTILPMVSQPAFSPEGDRENGLGDTSFSAFFSPKKSWNGIIWGVGPALLLPTSTDNQLGAGEWGAGPSVVFLTMPGNWVLGSVLSNVWSFSHDTSVNFFTWQPFVNYNLNDGWYLVSSPILTANWEADSSNDYWTVPIGGGVGKVFRIGSQPMNVQIQGFGNVEKPENIGPDWSLRFQVQFLFPK